MTFYICKCVCVCVCPKGSGEVNFLIKFISFFECTDSFVCICGFTPLFLCLYVRVHLSEFVGILLCVFLCAHFLVYVYILFLVGKMCICVPIYFMCVHVNPFYICLYSFVFMYVCIVGVPQLNDFADKYAATSLLGKIRNHATIFFLF